MKKVEQVLCAGGLWGIVSSYLYLSVPRVTDNLLLTYPSKLVLGVAGRFGLVWVGVPETYIFSLVGGALTTYTIYSLIKQLKIIK